MRRLFFVLAALTVAGTVAYRQRCIERCEQELGIGRHAGDPPGQAA